MAHFGLICVPASGHLNPMTALGHELKQRGHKITLIGLLDAQSKAIAADLDFCPLGETECPLGYVTKSLNRVGEMSDLAALLYTINEYVKGAHLTLRESPRAIKAAGIEALLIDQSVIEGGTIAEYLGLPFITICSALMLNSEPRVPPIFLSWDYSIEWWAPIRNQLGSTFFALLGLQLKKVIEEYRQQWSLPKYISPKNLWSPLAQISQEPIEFEFPREDLPDHFFFTGPFSNPASREAVDFPFEKLTGQPLIYASLGTVQNRLMSIFNNIAEACVGLNAQLVISLGGSSSPESLPTLPGNPLVVNYAPQLELLQKATLTITHAGLNTTMESLSNGVPMVAIPIANDQPGVAARIVWTGTGEVVALSNLSVHKLRAAIQRVLSEDFYKNNALKLQEAIRKAGGVSRAADIVEQVVSTGKPVYR